MKLVTFQPLSVKNALDTQGEYVPPINKIIGQHVFCLAVNRDTMETLYLTAPSMPQVMFVLDVDDARVTEIDYIQWANYLYTKECVNEQIKYIQDDTKLSKYKEYIIDSIKASDVVSYQVICTDSDPDVVQDYFMNTHYDELEKLSGNCWYRLADDDFVSFWGTEEAEELVVRIQNCLMPIWGLTETFMDETRQMVREVFIK